MPSSSHPPSSEEPPGTPSGEAPAPPSEGSSAPWAEVLLSFVQRYPGLHVRELIRRLKIPIGTLDYHLYRLGQKGLLETRDVGGYRCVFPNRPVGEGPPIPEDQKAVLALLRLPTPRTILLHLYLKGFASAKDLAGSAGISASTLSYYMDRLEGLGLIARQGAPGGPRRVTLKDPELVRRVLLAYPPLPEGAGDRWVRLWEGLR